MSAVLLLAACSEQLGGKGQAGNAGNPGTGQGGGGGIGGSGTGGVAGGPTLPACPTGAPTFSVCVVSDADVLPFSATATWHDSVTAAAATVEAVGAGAAPAQCQSARVFGAATSSAWWVRVGAADKGFWTIGVGGLGDTPLVQAGETVTLDLDYYRTNTMPGLPTPGGHVQLSDRAGTPLLWAGSTSAGTTWLSLAPGRALCARANGTGCNITRYEVSATVNGNVATVAPFGAVSLGGYDLVTGQYETGAGFHTECSANGPPPFSAAAVKRP